MADLTQKSMLLLDKLYNLKGDDNLILQEINSKIEGVKNSIDATEEQIKSLGQERQNKTQSLLAFSNQQEAFLTAFSDVGDDTFSALRNIGVDVNIASMVSVVAEKAPIFIQTSQEEIEKIGTNIQETSDHKAELEKELDALENSGKEAEASKGPGEQAAEDDTDPFLNDAIDTVVETGQASTSFIQRRFKVGYARAGRIIDQMEERGVISGYQGSKPREVLWTLEKLAEMKTTGLVTGNK